MEISNVAPSLIAVVVRRMLGVYLRVGLLPRRKAPRLKGSRRRTAIGPGTHPSPRPEGVRKRCRHTPWSKSRRCCTSAGDKVYYLLRTGQLRSLKIGKLRQITEQQLAEFIASLDDAPYELGTSWDVFT